MNDFLSFFRFVLPGLIYFVLLLLSFFFYDMKYLIDTFKDKIELIGNIGGLGLIVISGALGYIFSILYRVGFPVHGFNQVKVVNYLQKKDKIKVSFGDDKPFETINDDCKGRIKAYEIVNVLWHLNHTHFDLDKTQFQASILNSLGAVCVASLASIISFPVLLYKIAYPFSICSFIPVWVILLMGFFLVMRYQYIKSRKMYERWINSSFVSIVLNNKTTEDNNTTEDKKTKPNDIEKDKKIFIDTITYVD